MLDSELAFQSATELRAHLGRGDISALELVDACARNYERWNPSLNAVVTPLYGPARERAQHADERRKRGDPLGALHGLPLALKDMTETAGIRTTYGSRAFANHVPNESAVLTQRLEAAGAILIGKTNTPEFAVGINTTNSLFGTTRNPWNTDHSSGGSSGGSAVALATGMCVLAEGSDHGGSIRTPAAMNGIVGLRPSPGRIPTYPNAWVYDPLCVNGPMARTVADAALMLSVMAGPDVRVPISIDQPGDQFANLETPEHLNGWRVAWSPTLNGLMRVDAEVARLVSSAAKRFSDLGCEVEEDAPDLQDAVRAIPLLRALRTAIVFHSQLDQPSQFEGAWLRDFVNRARSLSLNDVGLAESLRSTLWLRAERFFQTFRLLLLPTTQFVGFSAQHPYPEFISGQPVESIMEAILSTYTISILGLPSLSVPCGFAEDGSPVGLQIVGGWRREIDVLHAAAAFERLTRWTNRRPPITTTLQSA